METKAFEIGIMRTMGISQEGVIGLVVSQSVLLTASVLGFGALVSIQLLQVFDRSIGIRTSSHLASNAIIETLVIGLLIPILSSYSPLKSTLSSDLNDVISSSRQ